MNKEIRRGANDGLWSIYFALLLFVWAIASGFVAHKIFPVDSNRQSELRVALIVAGCLPCFIVAALVNGPWSRVGWPLWAGLCGFMMTYALRMAMFSSDGYGRTALSLFGHGFQIKVHIRDTPGDTPNLEGAYGLRSVRGVETEELVYY